MKMMKLDQDNEYLVASPGNKASSAGVPLSPHRNAWAGTPECHLASQLVEKITEACCRDLNTTNKEAKIKLITDTAMQIAEISIDKMKTNGWLVSTKHLISDDQPN